MRKAIICGGGIAGLGAAIGLARNAWSVDIYERSTTIREIGAGIFVKGNALRVLESFGVIDAIRGDCVALAEARTLDREGRLLQRRLLRDTTSIWNVKRELLIRALCDRATSLGARVHTDSPVDAIEARGAIRVRGEIHQAELVIAADGVSSLARRALALDEPVRPPSSGAMGSRAQPYRHAPPASRPSRRARRAGQAGRELGGPR